MIDIINGFKLYDIKPNTIHPYARVFIKEIYFNTPNTFKNRKIRVYLPSTYDFDNPANRFPVIYMMDGKNLFDDYTSFVGEWGIDETIESFIEKGRFKGYIVVGVDAPNENVARSLEMTPEDINVYKRFSFGKGYADKFGDFIFNKVKKEIDNTFFTLNDKENTFVGGSSMGGLMSFYLATHYEDKIKAALCFSPAFFLLKKQELVSFLKRTLKKDLPDMFFYVGNIGFENIFVEPTKMVYEFYKTYKKSIKTSYVFDEYKEHNEQAWKQYFVNALNFIE